ncbi:MAG: hypothetical protein ACOCP4_03695 [Candidatus Woesearchaeota archaeon]
MIIPEDIKSGVKIKIKTYGEMCNFYGHCKFQTPEFFKVYGNKVFTVVRKDGSFLDTRGAIVINESEHTGVDSERKLSVNAVKKVTNFNIPEELFKL